MATLTIRLRCPCGARIAIMTTAPVSTSAFAIHGFMAKHRPFHTVLRLSSKCFCPNNPL